MISEFVVAAILVAAGDRIIHRDGYKQLKIFREVCELKKTSFKVINLYKTSYGYEFVISLKNRTFNELEELEAILESNFEADIQIEAGENNGLATIKILKHRLNDDDFVFTPIKCQAHEIYVGLDNEFNSIVVNLNKFPHVLVSGATGSGKSEEIKLILTNLINSNSERFINLHFSNISGSNDYKDIIKCRQVKSYTEDLQESLSLFEYINHMFDKRMEIFKARGVTDIKEYNSKFSPDGKAMTYQYLILDEFADYFPTNAKTDSDYTVKFQCYNLLKHLARKGRKAGIFLIIGIQRPDTTVLDPSLRSNICVKIGFSQNNNASSLVVCDTGELTNLEDRKCLVMYANKRIWSRSLYINENIILKHINTSIGTNTLNSYLKTTMKAKEPKITIPEKKNKQANKAKNEIAATRSSRTRNIEVIENAKYRIENGKILISESRVVE